MMIGTYRRGSARIGTPAANSIRGTGPTTHRLKKTAHRPMSLRKVVAGVLLCLWIAGFCPAADDNSGQAADSKTKTKDRRTGTRRFSGGLIDPMNPQAYMSDLAGRLNSTAGQRSLMTRSESSRSASSTTTPGGYTSVRSSGPVSRNLGTFQSLGSRTSSRATPGTGVSRSAPANLNRYRALGGSASRSGAGPSSTQRSTARPASSGATNVARGPLPSETNTSAASTPIRRVPSALGKRFDSAQGMTGYRVLGNPNAARRLVASQQRPVTVDANRVTADQDAAAGGAGSEVQVAAPAEPGTSGFRPLWAETASPDAPRVVEARPPAAPQEQPGASVFAAAQPQRTVTEAAPPAVQPQPIVEDRAEPRMAEEPTAPPVDADLVDSLLAREASNESSMPAAPIADRAPASPARPARPASVESRRPEPLDAAPPDPVTTQEAAPSLTQRNMERYKALMNAITGGSTAATPERQPEPQPTTADAARDTRRAQPEPTREVAAAPEEPPLRREMGAYRPSETQPGRTAPTDAESSSLDRALARYKALYDRASQSTADSTEETSRLKQDLDQYRARVDAAPQRTPASTDDLWASMLNYDQPEDRSRPRQRREPAEPWSLGADLDKYRAHAAKEGARDSGESLAKAGERAGLALEDGLNVFTLGYASERGEPFRGNDGRGLLDDPGAVPIQAGQTLVHMGSGLYSLADLITLDALEDIDADVYWDNDPLVRPFVFTGRTIGGAWKTTEEVGNALTWGYFDNVTGAAGMCMEDIFEFLKHAAEAATNLVRGPVYLIAGRSEKTDEMLDWICLVPPEFASNVVAMKGVANMEDYEAAFADKGVIGSILELGGSTWLTYEAVDEICDCLDDDDGHSRRYKAADDQGPSQPGGTPSEPGPPSVPPSPDFVIIIYPDGTIVTSG